MAGYIYTLMTSLLLWEWERELLRELSSRWSVYEQQTPLDYQNLNHFEVHFKFKLVISVTLGTVEEPIKCMGTSSQRKPFC